MCVSLTKTHHHLYYYFQHDDVKIFSNETFSFFLFCFSEISRNVRKLFIKNCFKCIDDKLIEIRMHKACVPSVVNPFKKFLPLGIASKFKFFLLTRQITADCEWANWRHACICALNVKWRYKMNGRCIIKRSCTARF